MTYYPTLDEDLKRAKEILARGKGLPNDLPDHDRRQTHFEGAMIYGGDIYAAYKLLESFVETIEAMRASAREVAELTQPMHEEAMAQAVRLMLLEQELKAWKDAIIDATVVDWIFTKEHETNPRKAVNDLLAWGEKVALDPLVSKPAHDLHEEIKELRGQLEILTHPFDHNMECRFCDELGEHAEDCAWVKLMSNLSSAKAGNGDVPDKEPQQPENHHDHDHDPDEDLD